MAIEQSAKNASPEELLEKRQYWWWAEQARSPRIDYLRKAVWSKATKGASYLPGVKVCKWGPLKYAEAWDSYDAKLDPYMLTWAKALVKANDEIPAFIVDQSRIVGSCGSAPHNIYWVPNGSYSFNEDFYNDKDDIVEEADREEVKKAIDIMKPFTQQAIVERQLSKRQKIMCKTSQTFTGGPHLENTYYCTSQWEYHSKGYKAIIAEIDEHLEEAKGTLYGVGAKPQFHKEEHFLKRTDTWNSMKMTLESEIRYARRLSRLAKIIAENFETDSDRKQELLEISERCAWVPENKPRSFAEALQFEHIQTMCRKREKSDGAWPAHPDWWFWEYYEADVIKDKNITREDAMEYMCEYLIRAYEYGHCKDRQYREYMTGDPGPYVWTLGGKAPDGSMKYNDLTNLILESARLIRCVSPTYALRYNKDMPEDVLRNSFECIRHGLGYPNIRNDEVLIKAQKYWSNYTEDEARTWVAQACVVPCPETKECVIPARYASCTPLGSKCLELALWNGFNPVFSMQIGPKTGEATEMKTFDEIFEATLEQYKVIHWEGVKIRNIARYTEETIMGRPHLSACWERCVESGLSCFEAREKGNAWHSIFIWMDALDGLVALKKLVFDDKKYTMEQLLEMLKANWEGYEKERMDFVKAPKWGNDDDYCDDIIVKFHERWRDDVCMPCEYWGTTANGWPGVPQNIAAYTVCGPLLGALPNGRRLGDTCYDGGCSPGAGLDKKGPTAVLRSVGKLTHEDMFRADLLNQRLSPAQLVGEKGFQLWKSYIETWCDLGINHVQFNMVDNETLVAAQQQPEDYSELFVRVAGYSANFVELNKRTQDTIIARTIQEI
ncbi:MAG: formate acetyltransferase [Desulfosarcina sp.]|nr:formate acetyltransferase [Desulfobacterales bacterium]